MRAVPGLLVLLISLCGSQAETEGRTKCSDVLTEVNALKMMLIEAVMMQKIQQTQIDELKDELARGKQREKLLYLWVLSSSHVFHQFFLTVQSLNLLVRCFTREKKGGLLRSPEQHWKHRAVQGQ